MTALGDGVVVATRETDAVWMRSFVKNERRGEIRFNAVEKSPEPCWPWLASDRGRTLVGWDRLERVAKIWAEPLRVSLPAMELPDPFPSGTDTAEQACMRGFMLTDQTAYEVARPGTAARLAAVDLDSRQSHEIEFCPGRQGRLRIHSLDKDRGQVLVLLGASVEGGGGEYELLIARLDRSGNVIEPCRHLRSMPAGEPRVVGLAGAGDRAFLAWSTSAHIFLARVPLRETEERPRRWVLDRAPRGGQGVVRVGVVEERLHVAWEGHSRNGRWSLKLLRTEIDDLP
jgi:predicted small integral membrane protein